MTSTALLAHPVAAGPGSDFYITAAAVIPILFLAVTVQRNFYDRMVNGIIESFNRREAEHERVEGDSSRSAGLTAASLAVSAAPVLAVLVLILGVAAEILALASLYQGHPAPAPALVLWGAIVLTAVAAAPLAVALSKSIRLPRGSSQPIRIPWSAHHGLMEKMAAVAKKLGPPARAATPSDDEEAAPNTQDGTSL